MTVLIVLAALTCVTCIAVGLLVPALRPMAVSGGAALIFLVGLFGWWALLYLGAVPAPPRSPAGALLFLLPPVLPPVVFVYLMSRKDGPA